MFYRIASQRLGLMSLLAACLIVAAACTAVPLAPAPTPTTAVETPVAQPTAAAPEPTVAAPGPTVAVPGGMPPAGDAPAVDSARDTLAVELGLPLDAIRVVSVTPVDWRDGCLEVSRPDVACLQVITPGFRIILEVDGQQYEMRTNTEGTVVVQAGPHATGQPPTAAVRATAQLASLLGVELNDVRIVSAEYVEWSDSCLGLGGINESCLQVITPGYRVVLEANNREYTFHTDAEGRSIRPAADSAGQSSNGGQEPGSIIGWRDTTSEGCIDVFLGPDEVRFGNCGEELSAAEYLTATHRLEQLLDMEALYAPFAADTQAGKIAFNGRGPINPGPAEQRMMAEFAATVYNEIRTGGGAAQWGMEWRREGGIAGFCDDLIIDASGHALLRECGGTEPNEVGWRRLTEAELSQFFVWLDTLGAFEHEQSDAATADAMTISVIFAGRTEAQPSDADRDAIVGFGSSVLTQWAGPTDVRYVIAQRDAEIRTGPGIDFAAAGTVAAGQTALVTGVGLDEAWWRVVCPDDTAGFCYVSADPPATLPAAPAGQGGAIGGTDGAGSPARPTVAPDITPSATGTAGEVDEAAILSAVIRRVYTVDHTFAASPNFPTVYLVRVDDTDGGASPFTGTQVDVPVSLQQAIASGLSDLPPRLIWVADPNSVPRDTDGLVQGNGAIITVGNIVPQGDGTVHVAASIYIGSLAAGGQTYVLQQVAGNWEITGKTGPAWIS